MKFKNKIISLGLIGLLALGGVATATSFLIKEASATGDITAEGAIRLSFDSETQALTSVSGLTTSTPQFQTISFDWNLGGGLVTGNYNVVLNFELTTANTNLEIDIAHSEFGAETPEIIETLNSTTTTYAYTVSMESETKNDSLYLRYRLNASTSTLVEEDESLGSLKVSLNYEDTSITE